MRAEPRFTKQPKTFWANVRSISQQAGYTVRGSGTVRVPALHDMVRAMWDIGLESHHLERDDAPTELGATLMDYFRHRADAINTYVEPRLMDVERAREVYQRIRATYHPSCPLPTNKQKGDKAGPALLTCIVNMLIEQNADDQPVNYDPLELTTITYDGAPLRTLSRRLDGAFPSPVNPIAVWEIKEYYYTTTFGSRIADGVYETLLDGMELEELQEHENIDVEHLLIIDARGTWWSSGGRPYLCRILDMLHMGYVDEVLFGHEVVERLPAIVQGWVSRQRERERPRGAPGA